MVEVPIIHQSPGLCGPAVVLMGCFRLGIKTNENTLARLIGADPELGCEAPQIVYGLKKFGIYSFYQDNVLIKKISL